MGQADGQRHQLGRLVAGVAEHHALVARTGHVVVGAQRNVGALATRSIYIRQRGRKGS